MKLKINHVKFVTYGYHTIYLILFQSKIIRIKEKFVAIWLYCYFGGIRIRVSACARNYANEAALSLRVCTHFIYNFPNENQFNNMRSFDESKNK